MQSPRTSELDRDRYPRDARIVLVVDAEYRSDGTLAPSPTRSSLEQLALSWLPHRAGAGPFRPLFVPIDDRPRVRPSSTSPTNRLGRIVEDAFAVETNRSILAPDSCAVFTTTDRSPEVGVQRDLSHAHSRRVVTRSDARPERTQRLVGCVRDDDRRRRDDQSRCAGAPRGFGWHEALDLPE